MPTNKVLFAFLFFFALFSFQSLATAADVDPWFVEEMKDNQSILEPGTTTYCHKDFRVENLSDQDAEVHVILGNGAQYAHELLKPKSSKNYKFGSSYAMAEGWYGKDTIHVEDARIVNITGGTAELKVHC